jgi:large subunit ribosomal protein L24
MAVKLKFKKGDKVVVISGEHKGQQGTIMSIDREKYRAVVEGVNMISKHTRPSAKHPEGGIIKVAAPMNISNLMLLTPKNGTATRVGRKMEDGKIVRYSKKTGEILN